MKDERGTLVRIKSHRAAHAVKRILGDGVQYHFVFGGHNDYVFVPDDKLEAVLAVRSVGRARVPKDLRKCWGMSVVLAVLLLCPGAVSACPGIGLHVSSRSSLGVPGFRQVSWAYRFPARSARAVIDVRDASGRLWYRDDVRLGIDPPLPHAGSTTWSETFPLWIHERFTVRLSLLYRSCVWSLATGVTT